MFIAKRLVEFLPKRPVPNATECGDCVATGGGRERRRVPAMMVVRVDGRERFVCYHHLSLLYNDSLKSKVRTSNPDTARKIQLSNSRRAPDGAKVLPQNHV
jgi:hypothetical protein